MRSYFFIGIFLLNVTSFLNARDYDSVDFGERIRECYEERTCDHVYQWIEDRENVSFEQLQERIEKDNQFLNDFSQQESLDLDIEELLLLQFILNAIEQDVKEYTRYVNRFHHEIRYAL